MRVADTKIAWGDAARQAAFERWIAGVAPRHGLDLASLAPASADASFRRYLRVAAADGGGSLIVMDAPPPQEDVRPFVHVAGLAAAAGLHAPRVLEADADHGFLLLTDLGRTLYLEALRDAAGARGRPPDARRAGGAAALAAGGAGGGAAALRRSVAGARAGSCFPNGACSASSASSWSDAEHAAWQGLCGLLIRSALAQPVVAVHADWMPRNLMVAAPGAASPGILDFQDAVAGPITYDLASLLRDAFLSWDEEQELDWAVRWWQQARQAGLPVDADFGEFWRALEWMGLQRHLKVLGIFCRLKHRDGKARYAEDLPRFFGYAQRVALRYAPLQAAAAAAGAAVGRRVAGRLHVLTRARGERWRGASAESRLRRQSSPSTPFTARRPQQAPGGIRF